MRHINTPSNSRLIAIAGLVAIGFGVLTLISGGSVLLGGASARNAAGHVVEFVLWFNVATGALYVAVGIGLLMRRNWAAKGAVLLSVAIAAVGISLAGHIWSGGQYEVRTVAAMTLRLLVWLAIAAIACRAFSCFGLKKLN